MPIVNFNIPEALAVRIDRQIKKKGYASRAEFFRDAVQEALNGSKSEAELTLEESIRGIEEHLKRHQDRKKAPKSLLRQIKGI